MSGNGTVRSGGGQAIRSGKLPSRRPQSTWAGPGCGASCAICGLLINESELEYELEFGPGDDNNQPIHHTHISCFWAWESEHQKQASKQGTDKAIELSSDMAETRLAQDEGEVSGSRGAA